jgi:ribosome-associated protein
MTAKSKVERIINIADDMKAERIETLDVREKTAVTDYFVVCSGTSDRHVQSIVDKVADTLRESKVRPLRVEGRQTGWVLLDFGDVVLNVMREEQRQFYDLETLWNNRQTDPNLT